MAPLDSESTAGRRGDLEFEEPPNPLRHYAGVLRRRARYSIICLVAGLFLGLVASFFIKPAEVTTRYYKAVTTLTLPLDVHDSDSSGYSLTRAAELLQTDALRDAVGEELDLDPIELRKRLWSQVRGEESAIDIAAIGTDAEAAEELADAAAATLAEMAGEASLISYADNLDALTEQQQQLEARIATLGDSPTDLAEAERLRSDLSQVQLAIGTMNATTSGFDLTPTQDAHAQEINEAGYKSRQEAALNRAGQIEQNTRGVTSPDQQIDETDLDRPSVPGRGELILIGGAIGLIIGIVISFIIEAWDDKVRSRARVESLTDLPVIAEIPNLTEEESATASISMVDAPRSPTAERYRATCTAALFALGESATERPAGVHDNDDDDTPVILVTSPNPGEGKTTTSANITAALADTGRRVLAVDADFRRPALARFLAPVPSLEHPDAPATTRVENVWFIAAPHDVTASGDTVFELRKLIAKHQNDFDVVIVDTPPMLTTNDATDLLPAASATLLVFRAGRTRTASAQRAATVLSRLRADVLGVVLNGCDRKEMENYYGYGYGYGYAYGYGYGETGSKNGNSKKSKKRGRRGKGRDDSPKSPPQTIDVPSAF